MQLMWLSGPTGNVRTISITTRTVLTAAVVIGLFLVTAGFLLHFVGFKIAVEYNPDLARSIGGVTTEAEVARHPKVPVLAHFAEDDQWIPMDTVHAFAKAHPQVQVHTVLGFIFGHNKPSLALFEKFGFETWAHLPRVANLDGVERDLIILGKRVA